MQSRSDEDGGGGGGVEKITPLAARRVRRMMDRPIRPPARIVRVRLQTSSPHPRYACMSLNRLIDNGRCRRDVEIGLAQVFHGSFVDRSRAI